MKKKPQLIDVFLAHSHLDSGLAHLVSNAFAEAGLTVFSAADSLKEGTHLEESTREAIFEARAFVAILTPSYVHSSNLLFELGGAWGLGKPIFLLREDLSSKDLPIPLRSYESRSMKELKKLVETVSKCSAPLAEADRALLIEAYQQLGISSDQLAIHPESLDLLARSFHDKSQTPLSTDRLLQELVRLRKQGSLPKAPKKRSKVG